MKPALAKPTADTVANRVWNLLAQDHAVIHAIFDAWFYPAPWMGWAPKLCAIVSKVKS